MGQPQHRQISVRTDRSTGMLQHPPQQRHRSSAAGHRQVNHAIAIPQDRRIQRQVESPSFPPMNGGQHQRHVQTFDPHPTITHKPLPPSFDALRLSGTTGHIGLPFRQAQLTAAHQGRHHPRQGFEVPQIPAMAILTQQGQHLIIETGGGWHDIDSKIRKFQRLMSPHLFPLTLRGFKPFTHFCQAVRVSAIPGTVHPHQRGDNGSPEIPGDGHQDGSPPPAWGQPSPLPLVYCVNPGSPPPAWGQRSNSRANSEKNSGSPPPAWGQLAVENWQCLKKYGSPPPAWGQRNPFVTFGADRLGSPPPAWGQHIPVFPARAQTAGSPPPAWGQR